MTMSVKTTISIERETKEKLNLIGHKGLTYDQILKQLLKETKN